MGLLVADNMDAILEASRVFGNFSRFKDVRDILSSHKGTLQYSPNGIDNAIYFKQNYVKV